MLRILLLAPVYQPSAWFARVYFIFFILIIVFIIIFVIISCLIARVQLSAKHLSHGVVEPSKSIHHLHPSYCLSIPKKYIHLE